MYLESLRSYQDNVLFPQLTLNRTSGYYNADVFSGLLTIAFLLLVILTLQVCLKETDKDN